MADVIDIARHRKPPTEAERLVAARQAVEELKAALAPFWEATGPEPSGEVGTDINDHLFGLTIGDFFLIMTPDLGTCPQMVNRFLEVRGPAIEARLTEALFGRPETQPQSRPDAS